MIVADTNLIAYLLIEGEHTAAAQAVFRKDPLWAAPLLWRSELRNVLALYMRGGHLSLPDATRLMDEAEAVLVDHEYEVPSAPVLELASRSGRTAYDCEFVHLARELGAPLVTSDGQLLQAFPGIAISPVEFAP